MNRSTALRVFGILESAVDTSLEDDPPVFDVRWDAASTSDTGRDHRIWVKGSRAVGSLSPDALQFVCETAKEQEVEWVELENNGVALY